MNAPDRPPMLEVPMAPPFLTASLSSASAAVVPGPPQRFDAHRLEDLGDGVALGGRGSEREVDDADRDAEAPRGLAGDELADARDLERRRLDRLGDGGEVGVLGQRVDDRADHAGAGDADVDDLVGLAGAVDGAGHERVVLDHVGEDHELGAADAVVGRR